MEWDLGREYGAVADAYGLDTPALQRFAVEGIASTWQDDSDKRALAAEFAAALAEDATRQGLPAPRDPA
jgi:hypothetical protein